MKLKSTEAQTLQEVFIKRRKFSKKEIGLLKGMKATTQVSAEALPKLSMLCPISFYHPYSVPYAMRAKVEEELDGLLKEGIISPVKYAE